MTLDELLQRWSLPPQFAHELRQVLSQVEAPRGDKYDTRSEAWAANDCRIVGARVGLVTWRNNVGVLQDENGRPVRYGLANETPTMNRILKSGDDIGIFPYKVRPGDIGRELGVFVSVEHKKPSWKYTGKGREVAQGVWQNVINNFGGVALFATKGQDVIDTLVSKRLLSLDQIPKAPL